MKTTIDIMANGDINFIAKSKAECLTALGQTTQRRISRVEPCNNVLRQAFRLIRRHANDASPVAQWTRNWKCRWRVRMLDTGHTFGQFENRQRAIEAEVERWHSHESFCE